MRLWFAVCVCGINMTAFCISLNHMHCEYVSWMPYYIIWFSRFCIVTEPKPHVTKLHSLEYNYLVFTMKTQSEKRLCTRRGIHSGCKTIISINIQQQRRCGECVLLCMSVDQFKWNCWRAHIAKVPVPLNSYIFSCMSQSLFLPLIILVVCAKADLVNEFNEHFCSKKKKT